MEKLRMLIQLGCYVVEFVLKYFPCIVRFKYKHPNGVFLVMTPEHQNLGDHAIAYAETQMLDRLGITYYEITSKQLKVLFYLKLLGVMNRSPILFTGGGNLGMLWPSLEKQIRATIKSNPDSDILILPNTIYYSDEPKDQLEQKASVEIYNRHPKLHLYAREHISYKKMRELYNNVKLVPDMVLSFDRMAEQKKRKGCILCLRRDCERTRTREVEQEIRKITAELFDEEVLNLDMLADCLILPQNRENELRKQFEKFSSAELVITDRLHGMIFCAVSGTPCIVIDSKSPKVRGCYEWIRNLEYIRFADYPEQISELYKTMPKYGSYDNKHLLNYYKQLEDDIIHMLAERK